MTAREPATVGGAKPEAVGVGPDGRTVRTGAKLADGRAVLYYDRAPGADHTATDRRSGLAPTASTSQVRWNPLFGEYATIAGHRQSRTYRPAAISCPLCPSGPDSSTEVPADDYEVAVFENRFPSFSRHDLTPPSGGDPLFAFAPSEGRCEVVCFTSAHDRQFSQLDPEHARTVVDAWADRTVALSEVPSVEYVFCFENRGEQIGVTLSHPHGQVYGYPFVPARMARAGESAAAYLRTSGTCLQCKLLAAELKARTRIVCESAHWVCYVPFAARWPYEVRVVPREHQPDLPSLSPAQRDDLARFYLDVLGRFDRLFDTPAPYIAGWQQAPVRDGADAWHLAAEIFTIRRAPGKLKYLAGSESGAEAWINDIAPETAARRLRNAGP